MRRWLCSLLPLSLALAIAGGGCSSTSATASAREITLRAQLVGGDRALGDVGDFLIENDQIRVVIQKPGFSRGFGVYGGSLIDADRRRPNEQGTSGEASGNDQFGELFPAFFVQAVNVDTVRVSKTGESGGPAAIEATGVAGDFLELLALLNRAATGSNVDSQSLTSAPRIRYRTTYELEPGKRHVTIRFEVKNVSSDVLRFPSDEAVRLLGLVNLPLEGFTLPIGDVALFGATSNVFMPGIGFDSRFGLEEAYDKKVDFPAFPGLVTEWVASRGDGASYGLLAQKSERNYVFGKKAVYEDANTTVSDSSILVPFAASGFLGLFYESAPPDLAPGATFEVTKYFLVGSGDVGSVLDVMHEVRGLPTGRFGGQVFDSTTGQPSVGTSVVVYRRDPVKSTRRIYAQYDVRENGSFGGTLEPGSYSLRLQGEARQLGAFVDFEIVEGRSSGFRLESDPPGRIMVRVLDAEGHPLPAKSSAVGTYGPEGVGKLPRDFLYDLRVGERFRPTDMREDDANDPTTREYIENVGFARRGVVELRVRPGTYRVVTSRGPEYDLAASEITVGPDEVSTVTHKLTRVVDTRGWIAGDMHVHSRNSIDSSMSLDERVLALAAEGVEWAVSTDHNYVTDYAPFVARNDLFEWLHPMVGLEMTTLESGHFNGYPLGYQVGPITHGSFEWAGRPPDAIFADLRAMGSLGADRTIIQVNHARDGVLGYFSQYQRDAFTGREAVQGLAQQVLAPKGPAFRKADGSTAFTDAFDALEVANGKLFWELHHFRVPDALPEGPLPANVPPTGAIVRKAAGEPAFPGVVDDWFNLLNLGYQYVAVGTGDTHQGYDEAGQFRTMLFVGDDSPSALTDARIVDAMRSRRAVVTNGPMLDFFVEDPERGAMGKLVTRAPDRVRLTYKLTAAPWMSVARVNVYRNGVIAKVVTVDPSRDLAADPLSETLDLELAKDAGGAFIDSWFALEAIGYRSMFPVIRPLEVPPVLITEAVASLAGPLGLANDEVGALRPPEVFPVTPYALTNPVWLTKGEGPFKPPGVVPVEVQNLPENDPKMFAYVYPRSTVRRKAKRALRAETRPTERDDLRGKVPMFHPRSDNPFDVRKALSRFGHFKGHGD
jgi:hypothetical protein